MGDPADTRPAGPRVEDERLATVAAALGGFESAPRPLAGGITNRNFLVRRGGRVCVLRLPGADTALLGIDRDAEHLATEAAAAAGVGPPVVAYVAEAGCLVTGFIEGRTLEAGDVREPASLRDLAGALRAIHAGPALPGSFDAFAIARRYRDTALARGGTVPDTLDALLTRTDAIQDALAGHPEHAPVPCHNDLLPANLLHDGRRIRILDWEYAGMGDRYFDLANLAANSALEPAGEALLLEAYWGAPCTPRRLAALRVMRVMSDLREGMWGVVQATISELDFDFAAYAREHLDRVRAALDDPHHRDHLEALRGA